MKKLRTCVPVIALLLCVLLTATGCVGIARKAAEGLQGAAKAVEKAAEAAISKATPTPIPTPTPVPPDVVFKQGLQAVLSGAVGRVESIQSLQADRLFSPGEKLDTSRSSTTQATVTFKGEDGGSITTESRLNAQTGDASFTVSGQSGEETVQGGGLYFVGNDMLIRRAGTDKPMVRYTPDAALLASYKELSAMDRAARVLQKGEEPEKTTKDWDARIAQFVDAATAKAQQSDYTQGAADVALLDQQQKLDAITLTLSGDPSKTAITELLALVKENVGLSGLANSLAPGEGGKQEASPSPKAKKGAKPAKTPEASDTQRMDDLNAALNAASDASCTVTVVFLKGQAIRTVFAFTLDGKKTEWTMQQYSNGFERHNLILLAFDDGAQLQVEDKNVSAGGDNYKGGLTYEAKDAAGESLGGITGTSESVCTDAHIQTTWNITTAISLKSDGESKESNFDITSEWAQDKAPDGSTKATGKGSLSYDNDGKTESKEFELGLNQTYGDVTIDAPKFIEGSGVTAATREEALKALDIDAKDFDAQPAQTRAMTLLFMLMN